MKKGTHNQEKVFHHEIQKLKKLQHICAEKKEGPTTEGSTNKYNALLKKDEQPETQGGK